MKGISIVMIDEEKIRQLNIARKLVLCTVIVYIFVFVSMNSPYLTADNVRRVMFSVSKILKENVSTVSVIDFEESESNSYGVFKDGFVVLNQKTVSIYNKDNILISSHNLNFSNPVLKISGNNILCFDRGGSSLYILDSFDVTEKREFSDGIFNASLSDDGHVVVITDVFGYKAKVNVLDKKLEDLYYWCSSSNYLLDAFFIDGSNIGIVSVVPDKETTGIEFQKINYKKDDIFVDYTAADRFPVSIKMKSNDTIEVVSDTDIISLGNENYTKIYQNINASLDACFQDDKYTVLSKLIDASSNDYSVEAIDISGKVLFEKSFKDVRSAAVYHDAILILSENILYVLDNSGSVLYKEEVDNTVNKIIAKGETIFCVSSGHAWKKDISHVFVK